MEDVIHTTVHRNGQWVTEPINLKDIMNRNATKAPEEKLLIKSPRCGIMTRTVIESPVTHWILPVSLRSAQHKDVAFVGVSPGSPVPFVVPDTTLSPPSYSRPHMVNCLRGN